MALPLKHLSSIPVFSSFIAITNIILLPLSSQNLSYSSLFFASLISSPCVLLLILHFMMMEGDVFLFLSGFSLLHPLSSPWKPIFLWGIQFFIISPSDLQKVCIYLSLICSSLENKTALCIKIWQEVSSMISYFFVTASGNMLKMQLRDWTRGGVWWGSLSKRFGVADREGPGCLALPSISGLVSPILSQHTERGLWGSAGTICLGDLLSWRERERQLRTSVWARWVVLEEQQPAVNTSPPWKHTQGFLWPQLGGRRFLLNLPGKLVAKSWVLPLLGKLTQPSLWSWKFMSFFMEEKRKKKPHRDDVTIPGGI